MEIEVGSKWQNNSDKTVWAIVAKKSWPTLYDIVFVDSSPEAQYMPVSVSGGHLTRFFTEITECAACGKREPRKHPGHFSCGSPECREAFVKAVENRNYWRGRAISDANRVLARDARSALRRAADETFRYLAALNLQDHSVREQREHVEIVRKLGTALKPLAFAERPPRKR